MLTISSNDRFSLALMLGWRRVLLTLGVSIALGLPFAFSWPDGPLQLLSLTVTLGLMAMLAFGLSERWPRRLPDWLARWSLQVAAVALAVPSGMYLLFLLMGGRDEPPVWQGIEQVNSCVMLSILGLLLAPWIALASLLRQKDRLARHQALFFNWNAAYWSARRLMRACACCRHKSNRIFCSTRWRMCVNWWIPVHRKLPRCSAA